MLRDVLVIVTRAASVVSSARSSRNCGPAAIATDMDQSALDEADTAGVKMNGDRRRPVTPKAVNTPAILFRADIPTFPRMLWLMRNHSDSSG
jgi:hypothetical protein